MMEKMLCYFGKRLVARPSVLEVGGEYKGS
jgi:hypothetical protein